MKSRLYDEPQVPADAVQAARTRPPTGRQQPGLCVQRLLVCMMESRCVHQWLAAAERWAAGICQVKGGMLSQQATWTLPADLMQLQDQACWCWAAPGSAEHSLDASAPASCCEAAQARRQLQPGQTVAWWGLKVPERHHCAAVAQMWMLLWTPVQQHCCERGQCPAGVQEVSVQGYWWQHNLKWAVGW